MCKTRASTQGSLKNIWQKFELFRKLLCKNSEIQMIFDKMKVDENFREN
jgi:hypothetical protein